MAKVIQIAVSPEIDKAIRSAAKREMLTISSYTRRLLVQALKNANVPIQTEISEFQLPLLSEVERN